MAFFKMYLRRLRHVCKRARAGRGDNSMHEHGPDELVGPVRGSATWWQGTAAPPDPAEAPAPIVEKPPRKRKDAAPIRTELVERIKKEIAAGTYDTPEKWEAALECLLDRLDGNG